MSLPPMVEVAGRVCNIGIDQLAVLVKIDLADMERLVQVANDNAPRDPIRANRDRAWDQAWRPH